MINDFVFSWNIFLNAAGPDLQAVSGMGTTTPAVALIAGGNTNANDELLKAVSPALAAFISHLPAVEGIMMIASFYVFIYLSVNHSGLNQISTYIFFVWNI